MKSPLAIKEINTLRAGLSLQYSTVSSSHIGAHQVSRTYSSVSRKLCSPWPAPPRYPLPSLWGLHSPTFRRVCFRFHTQWAPAAFACLCLAYFTRHNVLQLHPCCLKRRDSLFLKAEWDSVVCVCVCVCVSGIFFVLLSIDTHPGCGRILLLGTALQNTGVQIRLWGPGFFFGYIPWRELLDHVVGGSTFSFLGKLHTAFHGGCTDAFPTTMHKVLFPLHFGSTCLFPGSRVCVTRAVTSHWLWRVLSWGLVDVERLSMSVWSFGRRLLRDTCSGPVPI